MNDVANDNLPATADDSRPAWFDAKLIDYMPAIRKLANKYWREDPEEHAQEVMFYCLRNWRSFREDGGFWLWLSYITRSLAQHKRRSNRAKLDKVTHSLEKAAMSSLVITPIQLNYVETCQILAAVPKDREGEILLRRANGEELHVIGADYGISRERVRQLEVRGRARTIKALGVAYRDKRAA
jgi:RNA polymerase sigma factor (sigma-70 family)